MARLGPDWRWAPAEQLPSAGAVGVGPFALLRLNARGDAALVWQAIDRQVTDLGGGNLFTLSVPGPVQGSVRPAGGAWSAASVLGAASMPQAMQVEIDASGAALALWNESGPDAACGGGGRRSTSTATLSATGWSATQPLSVPGCAYAVLAAPRLALDAAGDALAVFESEDTGRARAIQAADRPAGGGWSPAVTLSDPAAAGNDAPALAMASDGRAVAVWERYDAGSSDIRAAEFSFVQAAPAPVSQPAPAPVPAPKGDRTRPVVLFARATPVRPPKAAGAALRPVRRRVIVRVRARDTGSGVARMQFARVRARPAPPRPFRAAVTLPLAQRPAWVRVRDRAGNLSRWAPVRLVR
jgi:hypothetical protein